MIFIKYKIKKALELKELEIGRKDLDHKKISNVSF